jgi:Zn-dependent protease
MDKLTLGIAWYIVFVFSTVCHEAAHAFTAYRLGDKTAYHGGQVGLNPWPHIRREPFGMVVLPILSYAAGGWMIGWASTPYDPEWALNYPRRSALMALAGPTANLLLVVATGLLIRLGMLAGWFYAPPQINFTHVTAAMEGSRIMANVALLVSILFTLNLLLTVFNLIPLPPLDGSGAAPLFLSAESARRFHRILHQPGVSIIGLLVAWQIFGPVFRPLHRLALNLLYPGMGYH